MRNKPLQFRNNSDCIELTSHHLDRDGYPQLRHNNKLYSAHRLFYELFHGSIPPGDVIRHTCDNPRCVNVTHLSTGSQADNVRDRDERGRTARGERHGRAKLTENQVKAILASRLSTSLLARRFGVSPRAISYIKSGQHWKHLAA